MRLGRHCGLKRPNRGVRGTPAVPAYPSFVNMPAVEAALAANGRAIIGGIGDSTRKGYGGKIGGSGPFDDCFHNSAPYALGQTLAAMGFNVSRDTYALGAAQGSPDIHYGPGQMTVGSGWGIFGFGTPWGAGSYGNYGSSDPVANKIAIQAEQAWDTAEIFYRKYPGFGTISLDRGGSAQTVSSNNASDAFGKTVFTFPLGTQPVNIRAPNGFVLAEAIRLYNSTTPNLVMIEDYGNATWATAQWLSAGNPSDPFNALPQLGLAAAMINLGINDQYNGVSAATFKTNLNSLIAKIKSVNVPGLGVPADVVLEVPTHCAVVDAGELDAAHVQAVIDAASESSLRAPLNLRTLFTYEANPSYYYDGRHPNKLGYDIVGAAEAAYL